MLVRSGPLSAVVAAARTKGNVPVEDDSEGDGGGGGDDNDESDESDDEDKETETTSLLGARTKRMGRLSKRGACGALCRALLAPTLIAAVSLITPPFWTRSNDSVLSPPQFP